MYDFDWASLFLPSASWLELVTRGTVTYLSLFVLLRVILKRQSGTISITDLLLVMLIADAVQNGMSGSYTSITDGIILVITIICWSFALDWLGAHSRHFQRFVHPAPLPLVKDGKLLRRNMRREFIMEEELMSQLREHGVEELAEVKLAYLEGDGDISVITNGQKSQ
jgi:uncharacterized membrane protein YcaP (DUF421 family)